MCPNKKVTRSKLMSKVRPRRGCSALTVSLDHFSKQLGQVWWLTSVIPVTSDKSGKVRR
jgi:hypothetical protein